MDKRSMQLEGKGRMGRTRGSRSYFLMAVAAVGMALAGVLVALAGQQAEKKAQEHPQFELPKPGVEMERVAFQLGDWKTVEKHEAVMGAPGGEARGEYSVRLGPGGLSIIHDYRGQTPIGLMVGHGSLVWDAGAKNYQMYWLDNWNPGGFMMTGNWQGNDMVFEGDVHVEGMNFRMRQVVTDIRPNAYTMKIYMQEGSEWKLLFTMHLTKK